MVGLTAAPVCHISSLKLLSRLVELIPAVGCTSLHSGGDVSASLSSRRVK